MKLIFKYLPAFCLFLMMNNWSFAQQDAIETAKVALSDKAYKKALKNAMDATEHPETTKNPEAYYLVAISSHELSKDKFYVEKNPEVLKEAMKYALKGLEKDKGSKAYDTYEPQLRLLAKRNNQEADDNYKINKTARAISLYDQSFKLVGDTSAFYWLGKLSMFSGDTTLGQENYVMLISWYYESFMKNKDNAGFEEEPFVYFADYYWNKGKYDSANYYLDLGRTIFGATKKLDYYQSKIAWEQIDNMPPSAMMMEVIQKTQKYFPTDTALLKKENALFLYLIRNAISSNDSNNADRWISEFTKIKNERALSKDKPKYEKYDDFVEEKPENVLWLLSNYYFNNQHYQASSNLAWRYIKSTANSPKPADLESRWVVIMDHASKTKSLEYTALIINAAMAQFPKSKPIFDMRKTITMNNLTKELSLKDQGAFRDLVNAQPEIQNLPEVQKAHKTNVDVYVEGLIRDKQYGLAKQVIKAELVKTPQNPEWNRKLLYLAKEDFYYNFYETRTRPDTVAGMITNNFTWKGDVSRCDEGKIDLEIHKKVENRINYFRRNAGVPEIYLDPQYNEWCQKAAFMMEVNNKLDHDPKKNWACYSIEGATAAKYSLLIKDAHTSYAVTSFVADNNNVSLGNRRWMLYHNGKIFGHGSTEKYSSIWALDDSGTTDTAMFANQFVSWPPEGFTPQVVVFKNWSFSIYRDLKGAQVSMMENGKPVALKQHPVIEGYGMPTLAWTPEIDNKKAEDRTFEVSVKLADGRLYKYNVQVIAFDPVGY
jgi:hypothetical protein